MGEYVDSTQKSPWAPGAQTANLPCLKMHSVKCNWIENVQNIYFTYIYHIILFPVKDHMIMNLWAWTILNKQCLSVSDDSWRHDEMWEQRFEASPGAHLNFQPPVRTVSQGAQHNHFTYSGVSVAKYFVRKNKNRCCTSQVSFSDMGSLFASFLSSFSWIKCVPCSSQHSVRLLQRDGLFKAAQVADNEKWNGIYDAW